MYIIRRISICTDSMRTIGICMADISSEFRRGAASADEAAACPLFFTD